MGSHRAPEGEQEKARWGGPKEREEDEQKRIEEICVNLIESDQYPTIVVAFTEVKKSESMKIISWNIQGWNHPRKIKVLAKKLKIEKRVVLFLQEMKCKLETLEKVG